MGTEEDPELPGNLDTPKPAHLVPRDDVPSHVLEIVQGVRCLTKGSRDKDLAFLDYLLAMAEEEASTLLSRLDR